MVKVRQALATERIADVAAEIKAQFAAVDARSRIRPGSRVAIPISSRGIAEAPAILRAIIGEVRALGAQPFLVPGMGSHGGATAEGQLGVALGYGITEESMGVPIRCSMETVQVGATPNGAPVYMDQQAYAADHTIVVGRVKAHTAFKGAIESGVCKMMAVGLGNREGAQTMHRFGLGETIPQAAQVVLEKANVAFAVAIVENAYDQPYRIVAVPPERVHESDRELLQLANRLLPRVPFDPLDVLIVDWMGKNLSGSGLDYNVVGMWRRLGGEQRPFFRFIVALDLTPESEGNALGVGIADFTTRKLVAKINYEVTYTNVLTAGAIQAGKVPITLADDREAIATAYDLATRLRGAGERPRVARIHSTLHLGELYASENLLPEIRANPSLEVMGEPTALAWDGAGNLR